MESVLFLVLNLAHEMNIIKKEKESRSDFKVFLKAKNPTVPNWFVSNR